MIQDFITAFYTTPESIPREVITEEDTTVTFTRKECASVNLIEDYD